MPIVNMPSQNVYAQLAGAQAFGQTQQMRDDQRFATQVNQRDRHFYDSMANENAQMQYRTQAARQMAAENDYRQAEIQRNEFVARIKDEQENTDWQYTKDQERRIKQIDEAEQHFKRMVANDPEGWDEQSVRDVEWQMFQERNNIRPMPRPKPDPFKDMQSVTDPKTQKTFKIIPGAKRNGKPLFFDPQDPFAMDPQEQAELRFQYELEAPQRLQEQQKLQLQEQKEAAARDLEMRKLRWEARKELMKMQEIDPATKEPKFDQKAIEDFKKENADLLGGGGQSTLPQPKNAAEFSALPSGTQFMAPDGTVRVKP